MRRRSVHSQSAQGAYETDGGPPRPCRLQVRADPRAARAGEPAAEHLGGFFFEEGRRFAEPTLVWTKFGRRREEPWQQESLLYHPRRHDAFAQGFLSQRPAGPRCVRYQGRSQRPSDERRRHSPIFQPPPGASVIGRLLPRVGNLRALRNERCLAPARSPIRHGPVRTATARHPRPCRSRARWPTDRKA